MKLKMILIFLISFLPLNAQIIDTSAANFFPAHVGDTWNYQIAPPDYTEQYSIVRDSLGEDRSRYLFYDFDNKNPEYKIDTNLNVIRWPGTPIEAVDYKLDADSGDVWVVSDTTSEIIVNIVARIEDEFWSNVLGVNTKVKKISYYYQEPNDTLNFESWSNDVYLAAGFGVIMSQHDITTPEFIIGCIIDGQKYGVISTINNTRADYLIKDFELFPAFPNPFNSTTQINYTLLKNSFVEVRIFNLLGKEVAHLVSEKQSKGDHQIIFNADHLVSGTYFVVMRIDSHFKKFKITLIK